MQPEPAMRQLGSDTSCQDNSSESRGRRCAHQPDVSRCLTAAQTPRLCRFEAALTRHIGSLSAAATAGRNRRRGISACETGIGVISQNRTSGAGRLAHRPRVGRFPTNWLPSSPASNCRHWYAEASPTRSCREGVELY
jgi:hypothetical protein